jgi:putative transposase
MRTLCFEGDFNRRMSEYKDFCHERAEDVLDGFLKRFCNQWLQDEYDSQSGARKYERSVKRQDRRNGHYQRTLITRRGMVKVKVPRGEKGTYKFSLFKKYQRRSKEFDDVVTEALLLGHSGRKASMFFKKLLGPGTISHQTAARTLRRFDGEVQWWHKRPLRDNAVILVVDAVYFRGVAAFSKAARPVLFASAVYPDGKEDVVGFCLARSESEDAWQRFSADLYNRGLRNVQLIVHDDMNAITNATRTFWPQASDQLCVFHLLQNIMRLLVGDGNKRRIMDGLKFVYRAGNEVEFRQRLQMFLKKWRSYEHHAALKYLVWNAERSIRYFVLEERFWTIARTSNRLERLFKEFKRRFGVFGRFPNALSCERWLYALLKQHRRITSAPESQQDS